MLFSPLFFNNVLEVLAIAIEQINKKEEVKLLIQDDMIK